MSITLKLLDPVIPRLDCHGLTYTNVTEVAIRDNRAEIVQTYPMGQFKTVIAELITAVPGTIFYRSQGLDFQTLKLEAQ